MRVSGSVCIQLSLGDMALAITSIILMDFFKTFCRLTSVFKKAPPRKVEFSFEVTYFQLLFPDEAEPELSAKETLKASSFIGKSLAKRDRQETFKLF